ncbi:MlaD family protein [Nocardia sp. NPDC127579]|uniref:MlaD family protein n=1 Tax=Nocardia sp. NPDC127579 TaxID=3345402 RepID=UPI00363CB875
MLNRVLGSQAFMSIAGAVVIALLAVVGYFVAFDPLHKTQAYCAIMPDSIGLYEGNQVTMRGIAVGTVTSVRNQGATVRVDFEVDADHPVLADAGATTLSDTVVADRELAVLSTGTGTERWDGGQCITKTLTPKSLTQTLTALAQLSDEIVGPDPSQPNSLADGLSALDRASTGTGPQINELIKKLGSALKSPDADIANLAGIFDAFASVSKKVQEHWGDLKTMLTRLGPALNQASTELLGPGIQLFDGLREVLPMLNDITTMFGGQIGALLDRTVPLIKLLRANAGSLRDIVLTAPVVASAFRSVLDPATGVAGISYAPPRVALPQADAEQVCAALNALAPGRCAGASDGMMQVSLTQLVLGSVGTR